jgi:hypothetical protein
MPVLTDRRVIINAKEKERHLAYFDEHKNETKSCDLRITYIAPDKSKFYVFGVNGERKKMIDYREFTKEHGKISAVAKNGKYILMTNESSSLDNSIVKFT